MPPHPASWTPGSSGHGHPVKAFGRYDDEWGRADRPLHLTSYGVARLPGTDTSGQPARTAALIPCPPPCSSRYRDSRTVRLPTGGETLEE
ncbi:hypothetical protein [Streptomyces sp. NPDC059781]|uniref:hypothetical protein n=1 Tax=Streptomyces sp. NPDC059781 TaxID=3346943 RepID=UPI00364A3DCB